MFKHPYRKLSFYFIALTIPLVVLLGLEWGLRALNYHPEPELFIQADEMPGYMKPNLDVVQRFFPSAEMAPNVSPDSQYFLQQPPKDTLRIVVQGGSTAAGFPYGRWGSLSGMLQQQFKRLYPEKHIEVINTAMASVNSYTLLDFVDEIIAIKPDVVLIYAGHNEYLGIMGVGSAYASRGGRAANLVYLKFKDLKIYRLVESIYYALFTQDAEEKDTSQLDDRTLMAQMAKNKNIPFNSEAYQLGIEQFEGNMELILDKYRHANIPVIFGDLVSNQKDLIPFSALNDVSPSMLQEIENAPFSQRQSNIIKLQKDIKAGPADKLAGRNFLLGQNLLKNKQFKLAQSAFVQATDFDALRFRAPSEFNRVIAQLSQQQGVYLASVQDAFAKDSENGIIGNQHMLEHLHPTVRGYFVLSTAYLQALLDNNLLPGLTNLYIQDSWASQPVSLADAAYGEFKIANLVADYPFTLSPIKVELPSANSLENQALVERVKGKDWLSVNQTLFEGYQQQNNVEQAALVAGLMADAIPNNPQLTFIAGMLFKRKNDLPLSIHHLHRAINLEPNNIQARLSLAQNYYLTQQPEKSLNQLNAVKRIAPNHPDVDRFLHLVSQLKVSQQNQ